MNERLHAQVGTGLDILLLLMWLIALGYNYATGDTISAYVDLGFAAWKSWHLWKWWEYWRDRDDDDDDDKGTPIRAWWQLYRAPAV